MNANGVATKWARAHAAPVCLRATASMWSRHSASGSLSNSLRDLACQLRPVRRLDLGDGRSDLIVDPRLAQHALGDLGADLGLDLLGQLLL